MLNAAHDPTLITEQARRGFARLWDEPPGATNVQETVSGAFRTIVPLNAFAVARDAELCIADGFDALSEAYRLTGDINEFENQVELGRVRSKVVDVLNADIIAVHRYQGPDLLSLPLWPKSVPFGPEPFDGIPLFSIATDRMFRLANESHSPWRFWADWYQGLLDGKTVDWDLQRQIALIPSEDWDKGAEHIAAKIAEIQTKFLAAKAPLAETVEFNLETNKFRVVPIPIVNAALLGNTLAQIADALDDALADPANGLQETSLETRVLRRTLTRYGNDPQRIEMDFVSVAVGLRHQVEVSQDLPASSQLMALRHALEEGALAIRATHPEVAENRAIRATQALRELSPAQKQMLSNTLPLLEEISEGVMGEDFKEDVTTLVNDALLPVSTAAPRLPGVDASQRIFGRAAKMSVLAISADVVKKIDGHPAYKGLGIVQRLKWVVDLGLWLWGVI